MNAAIIRGGGFLFVVGSGLLTAFLSQASSSDYRALFWNLLPFAAVHFVAVAVYFLRVHRWHRWLALGVGLFSGVAVAEMALRVL
jgi:hypothetical protein